MNDLCGLYNEEESALQYIKEKMESNRVSRRDLNQFIDSYHDLLVQSKVITKVSDRLQSKLSKANEKIVEQHETILEKNKLLEKTILQLIKAKMGKKASTVIFSFAIILFLSEEVLLGEIITVFVQLPYLGIALKGVLALGLKYMEGGLENYFMRLEQMKIIRVRKRGRWGEKIPVLFRGLVLGKAAV